MVTRLILCFDGTWDRPSANPNPALRVETNVVRFYNSVRSGVQADGSVQNKWYDTGVGSDWYDEIIGGAFGFGLDQKIRDGYKFLVSNYPDHRSGKYRGLDPRLQPRRIRGAKPGRHDPQRRIADPR